MIVLCVSNVSLIYLQFKALNLKLPYNIHLPLYFQCLSFIHLAHHIEPPLVHLAIDEKLLSVKYSTPSTIELRQSAVIVYAIECYASRSQLSPQCNEHRGVEPNKIFLNLDRDKVGSLPKCAIEPKLSSSLCEHLQNQLFLCIYARGRNFQNQTLFFHNLCIPYPISSLVARWNLLSSVNKKINENLSSQIIITRHKSQKWQFGGYPP